MVVVGLTGGIGSGKSTVAERLVALGARLVDADEVSRAVVEPGTPGLAAIVERFGTGVLGADGRLDRAALAARVFGHDDARRELNAVLHPLIGARMLERLAEIQASDPDAIAVLDIPLLAESGRDRYPLHGVIVVDAPVEVAVARLVAQRGFDEADARSRVAAQATRAQRRAIADVVIDNGGPLDALQPQVDDAWRWAQGLRHSAP